MHIYTRTGDKGETGLFGGSRALKDSLRVWSYGTVDEANSFLGLAYANIKHEDTKNIIRQIQKKLFVVGAHLASDEKGLEMLTEKVTQEDIDFLESIVDDFTKEYGKLTAFVIPGETSPSAMLHVARTVVRRAERQVVTLNAEEKGYDIILKYLNRLSDTIFAMAIKEVNRSKVT